MSGPKVSRVTIPNAGGDKRERDLPFSGNRMLYDGTDEGILSAASSMPVATVSHYISSGTVATAKETLFHYTNWIGFCGVLDSGQIWLSRFDTMNDPKELSYGLNLLKNRIDALASNSLEIKSKSEKFLSLVQFDNVYIACFSKNGDSLTQWRLYSGEGGLSFGFPSVLLRALPIAARFADLLPVIYSRAEQVRICDEIAKQIVQLDYNRISLEFEEVRQLLDQVNLTLYVLKQSGFRDENEVRLVVVDPVDDPKTRQLADGSEVKYLKVSIGAAFERALEIDFAFDVVEVALSSDPVEAVKTARQELDSRQIKCRQVRASSHHFRW